MSKEITSGQIKRNVGFSLLSQVVYVVIALIINLLVPKFIDEVQYAYWQAYLLYVGYVGILHLGLLDGIVLRYSQYDYEDLDKRRIRSQFLVLFFVTSLSMCFALSLWLLLPSSVFRSVLPFVAIGMVSRNVFYYTSYTFQITNRIQYYANLIILSRIIHGISVIILLSMNVNDFKWYCVADLFAEISAILICGPYNKGLYFGRIIPIKETIIETWNNISCGISLMFANWVSFFFTGLARIFVERHWDVLTFGKISFAFGIVNLFLLFVSALSVVLFPSLKRIDKSKMPSLFKSIRMGISFLYVLLLILYFPCCEIIKLWIPKYTESLWALGILLPMIIYASKVTLLTNNYLKAMRKEKNILAINLTSLLVAVILYTLCTFYFNNIMSLLISIIIVEIVRAVLSEYIVGKEFKMYFWKEQIIEVLITSIFMVCTQLHSQTMGLMIYLLVAAMYVLINRKTMCILIKTKVKI